MLYGIVEHRPGLRYYRDMPNLAQIRRKIKLASRITRDEPMGPHTTLGVGGPADLYCRPGSVEEAKRLWRVCRTEGLEVFVLGGGANILVSDRGIRGMVIDLGDIRGIETAGTEVIAAAGTPVSDVSEAAAAQDLAGLEFLYSMPGSVGGSVWMNARCYGSSISDVLEFVDVVRREPTGELTEERMHPRGDAFGYKRSPFQGMDCLILKAGFRLRRGSSRDSLETMQAYRADRVVKGHFEHPSAGSAFKNDRSFGEPTGRIIDSLGLRGYRSGGAAVSELHANIVVNTGRATARDVLAVLEHMEQVVLERRGLRLAREILLVGEWE